MKPYRLGKAESCLWLHSNHALTSFVTEVFFSFSCRNLSLWVGRTCLWRLQFLFLIWAHGVSALRILSLGYAAMVPASWYKPPPVLVKDSNLPCVQQPFTKDSWFLLEFVAPLDYGTWMGRVRKPRIQYPWIVLNVDGWMQWLFRYPWVPKSYFSFMPRWSKSSFFDASMVQISGGLDLLHPRELQHPCFLVESPFLLMSNSTGESSSTGMFVYIYIYV